MRTMLAAVALLVGLTILVSGGPADAVSNIPSSELISHPVSTTSLGLDRCFYDNSTVIDPCPAGFSCDFDEANAAPPLSSASA